jgi:flagellum-specific ATP synthase
MATYREAEDLINIGAYVAGSNPRVDLAIARFEAIRAFLRQGIYEVSTLDDAQRAVLALV